MQSCGVVGSGRLNWSYCQGNRDVSCENHRGDEGDHDHGNGEANNA